MISAYRQSRVLLLCLLLGIFGAHRLYLKKYKSGTLQLLTLGMAGIWMAVDFIFIACGTFKDKDGQPVRKW